MEWFAVTFELYRRVFVQAAQLTARNWPVLGSIFVYWALLQAATAILSTTGVFRGPLALLGGLGLNLLRAACISSFLFLVERMVRTGRASLEDFQASFGVYLWDVVGVMFVFWIVSLIATPLFASIAQGWAYWILLQLIFFVLFNAVPELIYLGHFPALALLGESYRFIGNNWIEWFPPTVAAIGLTFAVVQAVRMLGVALLADAALYLLVYFTMVLRGLLFLELSQSSHRSRLFRYRARS